MLPIEEAKTPLNGSFQLTRLHALVFPEKRTNISVVSPVVAVLIVPGEFYTRIGITLIRLHRERTPSNKIINDPRTAQRWGIAYRIFSRLYVVRV